MYKDQDYGLMVLITMLFASLCVTVIFGDCSNVEGTCLVPSLHYKGRFGSIKLV